MVEIGKNCVIVSRLLPIMISCLQPVQGKFTVIKDCAKIEDNTIIAPNTVVPSMSIFSGSVGQ